MKYRDLVQFDPIQEVVQLQLLMHVDNARLRLDTQPKQGELW